jgi:2-desacetyl-2-hydroxyethyl bacteriochlorophyllide A dehydrogenase
MKSIVIKAPGVVEIVEREMPRPKEGEALLKVLYGGICGSDLGSYNGTFAYFSYPRTPGHELSARIEKIGQNNRGLKEGMVVTCNPYFNCAHCYSCEHGLINACMDNQTMGVQREGAFSEYIPMPIDRIIDGKGLAPHLLTLVEPFCISYHGVKRAHVRKGDNVLIVGSGSIGILAAFSAMSKGAKVYMADISAQKLEKAQSLGVDGVILNSSPGEFNDQVGRITHGNGFDVCIEAVGLPSTFLNCIDAACFGGRVVQIGVGKRNADFNFTLIQKKELNLYGSRNSLTEDFTELIDVVLAGGLPLEQIITNTYPYLDAAKAFKDFSENTGDMLKVELDFTVK